MMRLVGLGDLLLRLGVLGRQLNPAIDLLLVFLEQLLVFITDLLTGRAGRLYPFDLLDTLGLFAIAAEVPGKERGQEQRRDGALPLGAQFAEREQEHGADAVDQQDVAPPQQHEGIGQPEDA